MQSMFLARDRWAPRIAICIGFIIGVATGCSSAPPTCMVSNCSGCCSEAGECLGPSKQDFHSCGSGGMTCKTCLPDELCSNAHCVYNPDAGLPVGGGSGKTGGGAGGGTASGGGTGGGGGSAAGG